MVIQFPCPECITLAVCKATVKDSLESYNPLIKLFNKCSLMNGYVRSNGLEVYLNIRYTNAEVYCLKREAHNLFTFFGLMI